MKRMLIAVLVLLLTIMVGVTAAGSKKDVVKYEVKVEIVYNALTPDEMGEIIVEIGQSHARACMVKFNVKKLGDNTTSITMTDSTWYSDTELCIDNNGNVVVCDD